MLDPTLKNLAQQNVCNKMICRKCYARLNIRAKNCRKCHSKDLRKKK
jgi:large subunit ribosomal protein L40e